MSNRCDVCGGSQQNHVRSKGYNELYLTILKIGQSKVSSGLDYTTLLKELKVHGYDVTNGCVLLAIKHWFFNSFYHLSDHGNPCNNVEDLDNHPTCNFILTGESSLVLLEHEAMKSSAFQSKVAIWLAVAAIIISLFAGEIHDWLKPPQIVHNINISKVPVDR